MRNIVGSRVNLSTYQPPYDPEVEYCTEIPQEGEIFWVVDMVDQALRSMLIAIQIVRESGNNISEAVTSFYSTNHLDGTIKGKFNLAEGDYIMPIKGEGGPPLRYEHPLRIQMVNYSDIFPTAVPYLLASVLLAFFPTKLLKRNWGSI